MIVVVVVGATQIAYTSLVTFHQTPFTTLSQAIWHYAQAERRAATENYFMVKFNQSLAVTLNNTAAVYDMHR